MKIIFFIYIQHQQSLNKYFLHQPTTYTNIKSSIERGQPHKPKCNKNRFFLNDYLRNKMHWFNNVDRYQDKINFISYVLHVITSYRHINRHAILQNARKYIMKKKPKHFFISTTNNKIVNIRRKKGNVVTRLNFNQQQHNLIPLVYSFY